VSEAIQEYQITCPYCWEIYPLWLEVEDSVVELIEDCQVCCHPIQLRMETAKDGEVSLHAERAM
jgi:hypothetical protein